MSINISDPENLPARIIVADISEFEKVGCTKEFFSTLISKRSKNLGVERNGYFILSTEISFQGSNIEPPVLQLFKAASSAQRQGFKFMMIKFIKNPGS